jgi:hypothetical protein
MLVAALGGDDHGEEQDHARAEHRPGHDVAGGFRDDQGRRVFLFVLEEREPVEILLGAAGEQDEGQRDPQEPSSP